MLLARRTAAELPFNGLHWFLQAQFQLFQADFLQLFIFAEGNVFGWSESRR